MTKKREKMMPRKQKEFVRGKIYQKLDVFIWMKIVFDDLCCPSL